MKNQSCSRRVTLSILTVSILFTSNAWGAIHGWDVHEVFSNEDGTIQFVEMRCQGGSNEIAIGGKAVTSAATGNAYVFPANLPPNSTLNASILLATAAFAALPGAPIPDHIIPANFFSNSAEPFPGIEFHVYDDFIFAVGDLPTNGRDSLNAQGLNYVVLPNSPTNFDGISGNVDACPWDLDRDGEVGIVDFLDLLSNWNNPYGIVDFLDLLAAWGSC